MSWLTDYFKKYKKVKGAYIQYAAAGDKDDISRAEILRGFKYLEESDEEHGAFWVGVLNTGENVLEVDHSLLVTGAFEDDPEKDIRYRAKGKKEVYELFDLLLDMKFDQLKQRLQS